MLQLLQTGKVLYALAAICALGVFSKLVTSSLYKRLIKETNNMALTKNKNLKGLKQKTENLFLVTRGIRNPPAYIEKQIYGFRILKMSLDNWVNLSVQAMILCFLTGGLAAFASYWYRCDSYYIVLYGAMGVLSGLFLVFVDNGANISGKRQQLSDCLVDYVENSPHFYRTVDKQEMMDGEKSGEEVAGRRPRLREMNRKNSRAADEAAAGNSETSDGENSLSEIERNQSHGRASHSRQPGKLSVLSGKRETCGDHSKQAEQGDITGTEMPDSRMDFQARVRAGNDGGGDELGRSIEQLRQSLDQIAAGKETRRRSERGTASRESEKTMGKSRRELKPEEVKLLGELLQEYLT